MASSPDITQVSSPSAESQSQSHPSPSHVKRFPHLEAALGWTPKALQASEEGSTGSNETRKPSFWDMHLQDDLILKNVVCLPSLTETVAALVDNALSKLREESTLYELDAALAIINLESQNITVRDEGEVVNFYAATIASVCSIVASALEFEVPGCHSLLKWTVSRRHGGNNPDTTAKAIADGFLRVNIDSSTFLEDISTLPADIRKGLDAIRRHLANLATWEFKNLVAGSREVMEAIGALSRSGKPFPWTKCSETHKCRNLKHLEKDGLPKVTKVRTGPDATDTPWKFPDQITDGAGKADGEAPVTDVRSPPKSGEKRKMDDEAIRPGQETAEAKALCIIQQAWAEAVHDDVTLLNIQSGNFEFIGVRHRASQTLYLTELLDIPNSELSSGPDSKRQTDIAYVKLQAGFFIAALRDTMNRASQISAYEERNEPFPFVGDDKHIPARVPHVAYADPRKWLKRIPELGISVRYYDGDQSHPVVKFLRNPDSSDADSLTFQKLDDPFTTIKIAFGKRRSADSVFEARIDLYGHPLIPRAIVKFVHGTAAWPRLEKEYRTYLSLAERGLKGVVPVLGLYHNIAERGMMVLVMEDGGMPFTGTERNKDRLRAAFKSTLIEIHQAGYLHNNISSANFLVSSISKATTRVVGFADCVPMQNVNEQDAANRISAEHELLRKVLEGRADGHSSKRRHI